MTQENSTMVFKLAFTSLVVFLSFSSVTSSPVSTADLVKRGAILSAQVKPCQLT